MGHNSIPVNPVKFTPLLLNLSNHPAANWSPEQRTMAILLFGGIEDIPFPAVDPGAEPLEVAQLAGEYFKKIVERPDKMQCTVHLMGEMTFCYKLIARLKKAGIAVVASTTERTVTEETPGKKIVQFQFVRFRDY